MTHPMVCFPVYKHTQWNNLSLFWSDMFHSDCWGVIIQYTDVIIHDKPTDKFSATDHIYSSIVLKYVLWVICWNM